jgi:hypothetical protein
MFVIENIIVPCQISVNLYQNIPGGAPHTPLVFTPDFFNASKRQTAAGEIDC